MTFVLDQVFPNEFSCLSTRKQIIRKPKRSPPTTRLSIHHQHVPEHVTRYRLDTTDLTLHMQSIKPRHTLPHTLSRRDGVRRERVAFQTRRNRNRKAAFVPHQIGRCNSQRGGTVTEKLLSRSRRLQREPPEKIQPADE